MRTAVKGLVILLATSLTVSLSAQASQTQTGQTASGFKPTVGQAGKDVVWVPTPEALVEAMLNLAKLQPSDFHVDLGSGDGRTVIAAARRGSRALGIEYNPNMVELSRENAKAAGVPNLATFQQADIFETDFSKANVLTLFLLPSLNLKLRPTILNMAPGTRVVSNTFTMDDWEADETVTIDNCAAWCTALLWIVPAKVDGSWDLGGQALQLSQEFQVLSGTLGSAAISNARMRGTDISFSVGTRRYSGRVNGTTMSGTIDGGGRWTAVRK